VNESAAPPSLNATTATRPAVLAYSTFGTCCDQRIVPSALMRATPSAYGCSTPASPGTSWPPMTTPPSALREIGAQPPSNAYAPNCGTVTFHTGGAAAGPDLCFSTSGPRVTK